MKHLNKAYLAVILIVAALLTSCASTKPVRESNPNRKFTTENIPIHVRAEADWIRPIGAPDHPLRYTDNFIEILNDKAYVDLPYYGRVYFPKYSRDGLSFAEPYTDLKVVRTKQDDGSVMSFKVSHEGIKFDISITFYDGGQMDMAITPDCAQTCHFSGTWDESQLYDKYGNPVSRLFY